MYFIGSDKQGTRILNDKIDDVRMENLGGGLWYRSRGYKTLKILKAGEEILSKPCVNCGNIVKTKCLEPLKSELIEKNICRRCHFWFEKVKWEEENNPNAVRVEGNHYLITPDRPNAAFQGFGGAEFVIKFNDGREATSHNLWDQGAIPNIFKELLPDNASFITKQQR